MCVKTDMYLIYYSLIAAAARDLTATSNAAALLGKSFPVVFLTYTV